MSTTVMTFMLTLVLALCGGILNGPRGFLLGAALGYIIGNVINTRRRLLALEAQIRNLHESLEEIRTSVPSAATEQETSTENAAFRAIHPTQEPVFSKNLPAADREASQEVPLAPAGRRATNETQDHDSPRHSSFSFFISRHFSERTPFTLVQSFLAGGNLLVKTGLIVLFIGVAFLLKYASDRRFFTIELRLMCAAISGVALLVAGWHLRGRKENYALSLQGGGIGILYLTVFAGFRLYDLLPAVPAFAFLVVLCTLSSTLAVLQNSLSLAVLGVTGGFLAPILISTGKGNHVALFSYYALLNAGILGIAWFKAWRFLNLVGFTFTFGIGAVWGYLYYTPDHFLSSELFLVLFFLFYAAIAVLFAFRLPLQLKGYLDATIVFGTPIAVFLQQVVMVRPYSLGAAYSALVLAIFYLGLAWTLFRTKPREMRLLTEAFLSISVAFGTIAVPFGFNQFGTATAWALEGAALVWVGVRQGRVLARMTGLMLQLGAGVALLIHIVGSPPLQQHTAILNGPFIGSALIALAGLFSAWYLYRSLPQLKPWEGVMPVFAAIWGLFWWFGAGINEVELSLGSSFRTGGLLLFMAGSCIFFHYLTDPLHWPFLRYPALALLPSMYLLAAGHNFGHPSANGGYIGWPVAFGCFYLILRGSEEMKKEHLQWLHTATFWLLYILIIWESGWQGGNLSGHRGNWDDFGIGVSFSLVLLFVIAWANRLPWPTGKHYRAYIWYGPSPIAICAWLWALIACISNPGDPWPLSYIPVVNPLEVSTGLVFLSLLLWLFRLQTAEEMPSSALTAKVSTIYLLGSTFFVWMNTILIRSIHNWTGVPFSIDGILRSVLVQACLSIFWSLAALCIMLFSTRRLMRIPWLVGATLLGVVVIKLFLVDLSSTGTLERIISFIGVGILMLLVGYLSPVPPQAKGGHTPK